MMPLGDDNSGRRITPIVTYVLIAINVLVFFLELNNGEDFIQRWAFIPSRFLADPAGDRWDGLDISGQTTVPWHAPARAGWGITQQSDRGLLHRGIVSGWVLPSAAADPRHLRLTPLCCLPASAIENPLPAGRTGVDSQGW